MPVARCPCEDADECPFTPACPVEMAALGMTVSQANEGLRDELVEAEIWRKAYDEHSR
jgi:hypothetical protein